MSFSAQPRGSWRSSRLPLRGIEPLEVLGHLPPSSRCREVVVSGLDLLVRGSPAAAVVLLGNEAIDEVVAGAHATTANLGASHPSSSSTVWSSGTIAASVTVRA